MATGTVILPVQSAKLPTSNAARISGATANWTLRFDAATSQSAWWQFRIPANYSSTPVLKIQYAPPTTQSGTLAVVWRVYAQVVAPGASVTESYTTANSATSTMSNNQAAGIITELSVSISSLIGTFAAGSFIRIKIDRDASNGSDTATGDMSILNVSFEYTTT